MEASVSTIGKLMKNFLVNHVKITTLTHDKQSKPGEIFIKEIKLTRHTCNCSVRYIYDLYYMAAANIYIVLALCFTQAYFTISSMKTAPENLIHEHFLTFFFAGNFNGGGKRYWACARKIIKVCLSKIENGFYAYDATLCNI